MTDRRGFLSGLAATLGLSNMKAVGVDSAASSFLQPLRYAESALLSTGAWETPNPVGWGINPKSLFKPIAKPIDTSIINNDHEMFGVVVYVDPAGIYQNQNEAWGCVHANLPL